MVYAAVPAPSPRLEMWFDGPGQQRRWTVLIRLILAVPQAVVLALLEIALLVVTVIGWFAALVMGRLPPWVYRFNSGYLRWYARYVAYFYLLTDIYPPFEFNDLPYPARPIVAPPGPLNRLAVLFRLILVFPAAFFQAIVSYGLFVPIVFVAWLIMVCTGRMPRALYWAYASWVRYSARVLAYMLLITSEYPWGMLGDREPEVQFSVPPSWYPAATPDQPAPYTTGMGPAPDRDEGDLSGAWDSGPTSRAADAVAEPETTPRETDDPALESTASGWPPPSPPPVWSTAPPPSGPPLWDPAALPPPPVGAAVPPSRLSLPPGARKWLIFAIVWGSILFVGQVSVQAVVTGRNLDTSIRQYNTVVADFNAQKIAVDNAVAESRSCSSVQCLRASHLAAARSLVHFDSDLKAMHLSCTATGAAQTVESDLTQMASAFTALANSADAQSYRSTAQSSGLNTLFQSLPNDTNTLLNAMQSSNLGSFCAG